MSFFVVAVSNNAYKTITYSLTNAPAGMTITSAGAIAQIEWTPGSPNVNKVYDNIQINAFDGTDTTTRTFNVRVYPTL